MLNFKELSQDGRDLELLTREMLFTLGYKVYWSGNGPDGGKDLLFIEEFKSLFYTEHKRWLVQCKHKAISGKSVGKDELDDIITSCAHHECDGYLLVTSTYPSSSVNERLESITQNPRTNITAICWDAVKIEQTLQSPNLWPIAQRFFPETAKGWRIYATERPNHWVANYEGFYFHIRNRIGSGHIYYLKDIESKINEIKHNNENLPEKHFFRLRNVFFDDKHGTFSWSIDYMHPNDSESIVVFPSQLEQLFDDEWNQHYDFKIRKYFPSSDHYDQDHFDYYERFSGYS